MPDTHTLASTEVSRTSRFAKFLRGAVAIKTKPVTEVNKYPTVLWLSALPSGLDEIRSPLLTETWPSDDIRWLTVARVPEPDRLVPPEVCWPWLKQVDLDSPDAVPALNPYRNDTNDDGEPIEVAPTSVAHAAWEGYVTRDWSQWASRARIARAVRPSYQKLFATYQELQGKADAYDLFVGVGLLDSRIDSAQRIRRHLVAFPAELTLDDRSGTISVGPAAEFVAARVETDFLLPPERAKLQPHIDGLQEDFATLGPALHQRASIGSLLMRLVMPLNAVAEYVDSLAASEPAVGGARVSFAPALILRARSTRSLDELLARIEHDSLDSGSRLQPESAPLPWRRMMEDDRVWGPNPHDDAAVVPAVARVFFPLPSNDEQSRIVRFANGSAGVVVQGPPGTGKSHTIANLISHYLATGQRVLVTAQTSQALEVLRDKMPPDLQQLCVSLLGNSRANDKHLRRSVEGILSRHQGFDSRQHQGTILALAAKLTESETRLNDLERTLHQARAAETQELEPVAGYRGTRAQIARRLRSELPRLGWITDVISHHTPCPSYAFGWHRLAIYHRALDAPMKARLRRQCVTLPFTHEEAVAAVGAVVNAVNSTQLSAAPAVPFPLPATASAANLSIAYEWLTTLQKIERAKEPEDEAWTRDLQAVLLRSSFTTWRTLQTEAAETLARLNDDVAGQILAVEVTTRSAQEARRDLTSLADHYSAGGKRRYCLVFKPAIVKRTEWTEHAVTVEGLPIRTRDEVDRARRALDGLANLEVAWSVWQRWPAVRAGSPRSQVAVLRHRADLLTRFLDAGVAGGSVADDVRRWLDSCLAEMIPAADVAKVIAHRLAELDLASAREALGALISSLRQAIRNRDVVPPLLNLVDGLIAEDPEKVSAALADHSAEMTIRTVHQAYVTFINGVREAAPKLADAVVAGEGTPDWTVAFEDFEHAWQHRRAKSWLELVLSGERIEATHRAARDERQRSLEILGQLTAARAWASALSRIDDRRRASLVSWAQAVASIPATGLKVFRRRAEAQRLLGGCLDAIPAWVVSLGRLYETVEAAPGLFDVAIVDEASQCWLDSLVLFYLAKQVIVVGDDKQISPTIVGVGDEEIDALARAYLPDFEYGSRFTLGSSLFDHARRYLSAGVPLREHFRCVPEIIRFSNELCYSGNPLIPLRQVGKNRLEPLKRTYLPHGLRSGDVNEVEAKAIVDAIAQCHEDPAYEEADFGVMCLQGDMQGARIDQLLIDRLGPTVYSQRRLRCGNPYVFQGDERDVMFISMVAAPNVRQQSLTISMYEQRFNVAMSRARDQVWLFHSIQEDELGANCLRRRVLEFFSQLPNLRIHGSSLDIPTLQHAATLADRQVQRPPIPFDSWFEVDVALALVSRGYTLSAQVEVAHRSIDLVVEGNEGTRLAVECDGEAWHGAEHYAADVARQRQLERAGWTFVRVRESLFYSDQAKAIQDVVAACEELDIEPGDGRARSADVVPPDVPAAGHPATGGTESQTLISVVPPDREVAEAEVESPDLRSDESEGTELDAADLHSGQAPYATATRTLPFTGYDAKEYPDPRSAPLANVRDAVLDIVRSDGPLPKESIYRLYREGCPRIERAGKHLRQAVNRALYSLEKGGLVSSRDEGTRRLTTDVVVYLPDQVATISRPVGARKLDDVPLAELAVAIRSLRGPAPPVSEFDRVDLYREVGRRFGVRRLMVAAVQRLRRAEAVAYPVEQ